MAANGAAAPAAIAGKTEEEIRAAALRHLARLPADPLLPRPRPSEADLDPLGLIKRELHRELDPATYGFSEADWDRPILIFGSLGLGESATLRQIMDRLRKTYCGTIGVEFMHISDPDQKAWIQERIEHIENHTEFTVEGRRAILERLIEAEGLERFLDVKFVGTKRFGLDGGEALIPGLEQILKRGGQLGVQDIVIGMPHRGRLNILAHVMDKRYTALFSEFQGRSSQPEEMRGSGDVKYHLGTSADREFDGTTIHLSLTPNPSHLEAVNPVVMGKVRAKQDQSGDTERSQVMAILMHGDAAFAGQGLVAECLDLSDLERLPDRRHHPLHRQQPDRLHHAADLLALGPVLHGGRQDRAGADLPRQRRRSGGGGPRRAPRHRVPPEVQERHRHRHVLLPPARPQRVATSRPSPSR